MKKIIFVLALLAINANAARASTIRLIDENTAEVDCMILKSQESQPLALIGIPIRVSVNKPTIIFNDQEDIKDVEVTILVSSELGLQRLQLQLKDKFNKDNSQRKNGNGSGVLSVSLRQSIPDHTQSYFYDLRCGDVTH